MRNIGGLPAHLPRVHVTIEPTSSACPSCEGKLHRIGEDVRLTDPIIGEKR